MCNTNHSCLKTYLLFLVPPCFSCVFVFSSLSVSSRTDVDKEFAHYIAKLADLRMKSDKVDPKKLARNTVGSCVSYRTDLNDYYFFCVLSQFHIKIYLKQKYDETMIKLEASTESAIELFTKAEEMRERLITKEFVAWQKAQHMHLSVLAEAYQVVYLCDALTCM